MKVLVTGGSGGIGSAVCEHLASEGHVVAVGCWGRVHVAEQLTRRITDQGRRAISIRFDVRDGDAVEAAIARVAEDLDGLDALVLAAAVSHDALVASLGSRAAQDMYAVNVLGLMQCVRSALPWLLRSDDARIVTFSSILARLSVKGAGGYAATKAAIESLTRTLAVELGGKGVRVNSVAPGLVDVGLGAVRATSMKEGTPWNLPLSRAGKALDVAGVVSFLLSDAAAYITGTVLSVDGGLGAGSPVNARRDGGETGRARS